MVEYGHDLGLLGVRNGLREVVVVHQDQPGARRFEDGRRVATPTYCPDFLEITTKLSVSLRNSRVRWPPIWLNEST